jgi:Family of unknown function (DUF5685)
MFGLMRRAQRLPYCGTCKTLGALYGQRSRLLLNHDTVFLAELLMEHSQAEWSRAYRSFNCMSLPRSGDAMPLALQYAATAAVAIAHFQIVDQQLDSRRLRWRFAAQCFSPTYRRAAAQLRKWDFPLDEMTGILATQTAREAHATSVNEVAEPTATATAMIFSHGARLLGREDLAVGMWRIGHSFGYLVYVLDAFEDREHDRKSGNFNPFLRLPASVARDRVMAAAAEAERELPAEFAARLRSNVEQRVGLRPRILHQHRSRKPLQDRWRDAVSFARTLRNREHAGVIKGAAIVASVSMLAFLFPHPVRGAESWRHCLGLGMNLMALSEVFATTPSGPAPPPIQPFTPDVPQGKKSSSCCDGFCCCDGCDSCDCCDCCGSCDC